MERRIVVMVKPTDDCNLRCSYCYHSDFKYSKDIMSELMVSDLIEKTIGSYESLHLIWHGGEPLIAGKNFFKKVNKIISKFNDSGLIKITQAMQSNGTLLDDEFCDILIENNVQIGFSYDGENNDNVRGCGDLTIAGMNLVRNRGQRVGAIKVVLRTDIENIIEVYSHYKKRGIDLRLNPLFSCELVDKKEMLYTPQEYIEALKKLFDYWVRDTNCAIRIYPFEQYLGMIYGSGKRDCVNTSCITKFLSLNYAGDIYPCSRYFSEEFCMGNIKDISNITETFDSFNFGKFLEIAINRRNKCLRECDLFEFCQGGCNHDALTDEKLEDNGFFSCTVFKNILPYIKNTSKELDISSALNPRFLEFLKV